MRKNCPNDINNVTFHSRNLLFHRATYARMNCSRSQQIHRMLTNIVCTYLELVPYNIHIYQSLNDDE